jgi:hypothetical protein
MCCTQCHSSPPLPPQIDITQMLKDIKFESRSHEQEESSTINTDKTPYQRVYTCCGKRCPDFCYCCCCSYCCFLNPDPRALPPQIQRSSENVTRAGSIAFRARLRTPVDPAPLPAVQFINSMGADDRVKDIMWTSGTMSAPTLARH